MCTNSKLPYNVNAALEAREKDLLRKVKKYFEDYDTGAIEKIGDCLTEFIRHESEDGTPTYLADTTWAITQLMAFIADAAADYQSITSLEIQQHMLTN